MVYHKTNGFLASLLMGAMNNTDHCDHAEGVENLTKFRDLEMTFYSKVHPQVDIGLAISETKLAGKGKPHIFTLHGCRHIYDLIKSLDTLSKAITEGNTEPFTVLEAYLLLCAAHVHDAANVSKRQDHPERCNEILESYKDLFVGPLVIQQVWDIARVHGGDHPEFGKDTIRSLDADNSSSPRLPLLAALLRIADELSENPDRVPHLVAKNHPHTNHSKLAHAYAKSFARFEFRKESLFLVYNIYQEQQNMQVKVNGNRVDFFDYLEWKLDVIERESRYCSQYGRPAFNIAEIRVAINVHDGGVPSPIRMTEAFSLNLSHGYPDIDQPICLRSPELKERGVDGLRECLIPSVPRRESIFNRLGGLIRGD